MYWRLTDSGVAGVSVRVFSGRRAGVGAAAHGRGREGQRGAMCGGEDETGVM
jgi:hypothetical protein